MADVEALCRQLSGQQLLERYATATEIPFDLATEFAAMAVSPESPEAQLQSTRCIRVMLAEDEANIPRLVKELTEKGTVEYLAKQSLTRDDFPELQYEALWALTNIACGDTAAVELVLSLGVVSKAVSIIEASTDQKLLEQCFWLLGNVAGDCTNARDAVLALDAVRVMDRTMRMGGHKDGVYYNGVWACSNLVRGKPKPSFDLVAPLAPLFGAALTVPRCAQDALWGLSYMLDASNGEMERVIAALGESYIPSLVRGCTSIICNYKEAAAVFPAQRLLGNLATGTSQHTAWVASDPSFVPALLRCLFSPKRLLAREAAWLLSNVTADEPLVGNTYQQGLVHACMLVYDKSRVYGVEATGARSMRRCKTDRDEGADTGECSQAQIVAAVADLATGDATALAFLAPQVPEQTALEVRKELLFAVANAVSSCSGIGPTLHTSGPLVKFACAAAVDFAGESLPRGRRVLEEFLRCLHSIDETYKTTIIADMASQGLDQVTALLQELELSSDAVGQDAASSTGFRF